VDALVHQHARARGPRRALVLWVRLRLLAPLLLCSLTGCAGWWDEVTSRDFHFKDMFKPAPDPLMVAQTSADGDKKSKALRALKEPLANGGTPEQQDVVVKLLVNAATIDPQPLCRLAAIYTLGHFKDPRAGEALCEAYYRAGGINAPEVVPVIKCKALDALGETGNPVAIPLLVRVLKAPPVAGDDSARQQNLDERINAARALGHFSQYKAAEALVDVLKTDRDVALRNRVRESLCEITGQDYPADYQDWADFLHQSGDKDALARKPSLSDKILKLVSWPSQ
jgi:hypothetical protein